MRFKARVKKVYVGEKPERTYVQFELLDATTFLGETVYLVEKNGKKKRYKTIGSAVRDCYTANSHILDFLFQYARESLIITTKKDKSSDEEIIGVELIYG